MQAILDRSVKKEEGQVWEGFSGRDSLAVRCKLADKIT